MYEQEIPGDAAHERVLSIVVPCYNEEESIPLFYRETRKAANELRQRLRVQVEYVFVDDGSTDSTLDILKKLRAQDKQVHYVSFSRNFGKESALYAGLRAANGDFVATLDADLQDRSGGAGGDHQRVERRGRTLNDGQAHQFRGLDKRDQAGDDENGVHHVRRQCQRQTDGARHEHRIQPHV